ncbi:unnamed protein product [Aureobasidium uvarum]|uniref:RNA polymerase II subunit B1 CTD phosphatase RPAP2 homolog n=1 Tax=Aureobasidium uvarum TaxID=2773716 RepID=A0A9N8KK55_9PEZI|nr:unnamed protein product [Aureobasidium uvarum]
MAPYQPTPKTSNLLTISLHIRQNVNLTTTTKINPQKTSSHTTTSDLSEDSFTATLKIKPKSDIERKRLQTAISHATLIQEQKAILRQNLDAIEELSDIPLGDSATLAETERFLDAMVDFQGSDYDALIEERHVNGRCGYALCANAPRKALPKAPWMKNRGQDMWCSDACAKKALYIKAQLSETPAWERRAGDRNPLVLYGGSQASSSPQQMQLPVRQKETPAKSSERELAYERGEVDTVAAAKMGRVLAAQVQENSIISSVMPPTATSFADSDVHDLIEGYQPRGVQQGNRITIKSGDADSEEDD